MGKNQKIMKVGLVGCGENSKVHMNALLDTENCKVVGVCDIDRKRAEALASKYNVPGVYTDFSEMLKKEQLDIVDVLTPPQIHAVQSIEAMNAGVHVLVEKPMCMTVEEADQMIQASKQNNVKLGLVHSFIFTPAVRNALKEVKKGTIGDLIKVDTVISIKSLLEWEKAPGFPKWYYGLQGGLFGEILPHGLYIQLAFLGHVEKILGVTSGENSGKLTPFSELLVVMKCNKGVGNMFLSTRIQTPHTVLFVRAVGSKGVLYVSVPSATLTLTKMRSSISMVERALFNLEPAGQLLSGTIAMPAKMLSRSFKPHMTHNIIIKEFVENVRHGREPPVTAEEGREVIKATDMIWKNVLDWSK